MQEGTFARRRTCGLCAGVLFTVAFGALGVAASERPAGHRAAAKTALSATRNAVAPARAAAASVESQASAGRVSGATQWPGGSWSPPPPEFGVLTVRDVAFPMSDGVTLYGDVSYPVDLHTGARLNQRFPVLLTVNPYDTGGLGGQPGAEFGAVSPLPVSATYPYFVQRGYIDVAVDARGTGRSGGVDAFLSPRAQQGGAELIQAVAHGLDGSDGRVGLLGCSYLGEWAYFNAADAAGAGPSPVKATVAQCASGVFFREFFNVGGLMTSDFYEIENVFAASDASPGTSQPWTTATNVPDHAQSLFQHYVSSMASAATGGDRSVESLWWRQRSPLYRAADIVNNRIPVLGVTSYHDIFPEGALEMITALQNLERGQPEFGPLDPSAAPPTPRYQLIVGPGGHASGLSDEIALEWFDTWIKGMNTGLQSEHRPLHFWDDAAQRWSDVSRYPLTTDYRALYLGDGGTLTSSAPPAGGASDALGWEPEQAGGALTYTSSPLTASRLVVGPSDATIYASSTTSDVELVATLQDVASDGSATPIAKAGALIGSQRYEDTQRNWVDAHGRMIRPYHPLQEGDAQAVPTGQVERYDIEIPPTTWLLPAGHRLQLRLTSQLLNGSFGVLGPGISLIPTPQQAAALAGGTYAVQRNSAFASVIDVALLPETSLCTSPFIWAPAPQNVSTPLAGAKTCSMGG